MKTKNRYVKRAKISEAKFRQLLRLFVHELDARTIASVTQLNRNTVNRYLTLIRIRIAEFCEGHSPIIKERGKKAVGLDKACNHETIRAQKLKGSHIFGIYRQGDKIFTEIVPNCAKSLVKGIIQGRGDPKGVRLLMDLRGYNGVIELGYKKHYQLDNGIDHTQKPARIISSFCSFAIRRLIKFHGISDSTFYLHLKECEFRFNNLNTDLYKKLLKMFRENPLS